VSFTHRAVAAVLYEVEPLDRRIPVVVQSELVANEPLPDGEHDPRVAAALKSPLRAEWAVARDAHAALAHSTKASGLTLAAAMDHMIDGPPGTEVHSESLDDLARVTVTADVAPGRPLRLVKFLAYGWSSQRSVPAIRDQVACSRRFGSRYFTPFKQVPGVSSERSPQRGLPAQATRATRSGTPSRLSCRC
jgi:alpha,alpha-trehalose phosphorylase